VKSRTFIIVAHPLATVGNFDLKYYFDEDCIQATGNYDEYILAQNFFMKDGSSSLIYFRITILLYFITL
jgi:ABC-type bacteriocin/lantibiotic exporter with double-glycine peptidase domain